MGRKRKELDLTDNGSEVKRINTRLPLWLLRLRKLTRCFLKEVIAYLRQISFDYCKDSANSSLHTLLEKAMNEIAEL